MSVAKGCADCRSKISIKWGKPEKPGSDLVTNNVEEEDATESEESDVDMPEEEQQPPDLYRNSALGM